MVYLAFAETASGLLNLVVNVWGSWLNADGLLSSIIVLFNFQICYSEMNTAAYGEVPVCIAIYPVSDENINANLISAQTYCMKPRQNSGGLGDIGG